MSALDTQACVICDCKFVPHSYQIKSICGCCNERVTNEPNWPIGACPRNIEPRPVACVCIVGDPND